MIEGLEEIDRNRRADLLFEPRSTADRSRGVEIQQPTEFDRNRSADLIREPRSMAVESMGRDVVVAGVTNREACHV